MAPRRGSHGLRWLRTYGRTRSGRSAPCLWPPRARPRGREAAASMPSTQPALRPIQEGWRAGGPGRTAGRTSGCRIRRHWLRRRSRHPPPPSPTHVREDRAAMHRRVDHEYDAEQREPRCDYQVRVRCISDQSGRPWWHRQTGTAIKTRRAHHQALRGGSSEPVGGGGGRNAWPPCCLPERGSRGACPTEPSPQNA